MQIKFQTAKKAANSPPAFNKSNKFRGYFTGDQNPEIEDAHTRQWQKEKKQKSKQ
jgi:hypothetical protein